MYNAYTRNPPISEWHPTQQLCGLAKPKGTGISKALGAHPSSQCAHDVRLEVLRANVCPAGFWSCSGMVTSFLLPIPPFLRKVCHMAVPHCVLEVCNLVFDFDKLIPERVCLESQRKLWPYILEQCWDS
jgi:hypothetical protein